MNKEETNICFIISIIVASMFFISKPTVIGYDELIGPDQVPHHELIQSGWPMAAMTYWTLCTTGSFPQINWIPVGVLVDFVFSLCIVFHPYYLGTKIRSELNRMKVKKSD